MKHECFLLVWLRDESAIFYSVGNAHAYESGPCRYRPFCSHLGETCSLRVRLLVIGSKTVSMPPTKVCPQCKAHVPVRRKTCECCDHVFRSKRKAECNLREKAMKRMRAVESDSVKSARKAKDKLHKACQRASETRQRTLQQCAWQA